MDEHLELEMDSREQREERRGEERGTYDERVAGGVSFDHHFSGA